MRMNKIVIYKAHSIRKKKPELTLKEAYRLASIGHNYKTKKRKDVNV